MNMQWMMEVQQKDEYETKDEQVRCENEVSYTHYNK